MVTVARDTVLAGVGRKRGRGRPRTYDHQVHVNVTDDMYRRILIFAEQHELTITQAYRALMDIAFAELERGRSNDVI